MTWVRNYNILRLIYSLSLDGRFKSKRKKTRSRKINRSTVNDIFSRNSSSTSCVDLNELIDEVDADEVIPNNDTPLIINIETLINSKNAPRSPAIIIFDSLRIASKIRVAATLREFLQLEYDHKKLLPVEALERKLFNVDTIPTIEAAVPQQQNYFDCGLYILQYIESFFAHHRSTTNIQSSSMFANWCEKNFIGSSKRKEILNVISQHIIVKDD